MYQQAGARYDVRPNHDLASMAIRVNAGSTPARFTSSRVVSPNAKYSCHGISFGNCVREFKQQS